MCAREKKWLVIYTSLLQREGTSGTGGPLGKSVLGAELLHVKKVEDETYCRGIPRREERSQRERTMSEKPELVSARNQRAGPAQLWDIRRRPRLSSKHSARSHFSL